MAAPQWLDTAEYPFEPRYFPAPAGRMHYVEEGDGPPIVFVHGNPAWSFEFRNLIRAFSPTNRCIAPDHLGFGLSDKPSDWSYLPQDHAKNLELFLDSLGLEHVTLVVGDWGGPIGLSWALDHADRISNVVILNTWLWPVNTDIYYRAFSGVVGGPVGRRLIEHRNFFAGTMMRALFADKARLTDAVHAQYLMPLARPEDRKGSWVFPREIIGSSAWLQSLWEKRGRLSEKRFLITWGMKDIGFRRKELETWIREFPRARVVRFEDAGHFVPEEKPHELIAAMREFLVDAE